MAISQTTAPATPGLRSPLFNGPGSNGFFRREIYRKPGTYTFTSPKKGKVKIQAIGAGSGGGINSLANRSGASGSYGEKVLDVNIGDVLTIVVGAGSAPSNNNANMGGTTSISGTPVGGTPLVLTGAINLDGNIPGYPTPGNFTGPWDLAYIGAVTTTTAIGSPASASPFGPGVASLSTGGAGWGGPAQSSGGASTHSPSRSGAGAPGFTANGGAIATVAQVPGGTGETKPFWDLKDVDSGGGGFGNASSTPGGTGGVGAGGASSANVNGGESLLGGGSAVGATDATNRKAGFGAGGPCNPGTTGTSGSGGDGIVFLFWDND